MHKTAKLGCRCTPDLRRGWYAYCNECGWRFKITELMPGLISRHCKKPGPTGATIRVPEEELLVVN